MKHLYSRRVFPRSMRVQDFGWVGKCDGVTHHVKFGKDEINLRRVRAVIEEHDNALARIDHLA